MVTWMVFCMYKISREMNNILSKFLFKNISILYINVSQLNTKIALNKNNRYDSNYSEYFDVLVDHLVYWYLSNAIINYCIAKGVPDKLCKWHQRDSTLIATIYTWYKQHMNQVWASDMLVIIYRYNWPKWTHFRHSMDCFT